MGAARGGPPLRAYAGPQALSDVEFRATPEAPAEDALGAHQHKTEPEPEHESQDPFERCGILAGAAARREVVCRHIVKSWIALQASGGSHAGFRSNDGPRVNGRSEGPLGPFKFRKST
jgi:hypothetical protein